MATRCVLQSLAVGTKSFLSVVSRSYATSAPVFFPNRCYLARLRPLVAASCAPYFRQIYPSLTARGFATRSTSSSLNDPNPNWSNRPPKETILLDGCDFEHWLVVMEKPEGDPTRDEIIDSYIKTLAMVVGSEEDARMKIYSVSTRHYFAFGALVSEELSYKLKDLQRVRWVLPDSYLDVKNKDYGGEPFVNGQAVPYDPKYHEEWVRNNARANERNRRNDRPRQFDRSRNFERRREQQMGNPNNGENFGAPTGQANYGPNMSSQPNMGGQPSYMNPASPTNAPHSGPAPVQPNMGGQPNYMNPASPTYAPHSGPAPVQPNMGGQPGYPGFVPPNAGGQPGHANNMPPNMGRQPSYPNMPPNSPSSVGGYPNQGGFPPNSPGFSRGPPNNAPYQSGPNSGQTRYPPGPSGFGPGAGSFQGQYQNPSSQPSGYGPGPGQSYHAPNAAPNLGQNNSYQGYGPNVHGGDQPHTQNNPPQVQNDSTRD